MSTQLQIKHNQFVLIMEWFELIRVVESYWSSGVGFKDFGREFFPLMQSNRIGLGDLVLKKFSDFAKIDKIEPMKDSTQLLKQYCGSFQNCSE